MAMLPAKLTSLELRNFRAFEQQYVDFAPLTVFVGPNNAGKSSILSGIRILAQTLQSVDWNVPLLLWEFGTFRDIAHGNKSTKTVGITLGISWEGGKTRSFRVNFKYRAQRREIILRDFTLFDENGQPLLRTTYSKDSERQTIKQIPGVAGELLTKLLTKPFRVFHFIPRVGQIIIQLDRLRSQQKLPFSYRKNLFEIDETCRRVMNLLDAVQYVGPFRENPLRLYPFSGERPSVVESTGKGATDILVADYFRRGTRKRELSNLVRDWLAKARIADDVQVRAVSDRHYDIRLKHPKTGELENLADVGYGISQVLPVIVAGYNLSPGSIFMIEQPEIHLHPRAQAELGDFFLHLYNRGIQCIVETHSEHLIMRLQRHVASGKIAPSDVAVNYVTAGKASKDVIRLPINDDGIFEQKWPEGFFDERMEEALALARAPLIRKGEIG